MLFSKGIRYTEELLHEKTNIDSFNTETEMRHSFKFKFVEILKLFSIKTLKLY